MAEIVVENELIIKTPNHVPYEPTRKIGIVVPVLNYFIGLADLLLSVKTKHDWRVYVMPQYIHNQPLSAAWNQGAARAFAEGCKYALVCNDDILFAPDCIDTLVGEYERLRPQGVLMVTPNNIMGQFADNKYAILDYYRPEGQESTVSDHPNFSCFMHTEELTEIAGTFDEKFVPAWFEDNDMHRRITLSGHRAICTTAANTVHIGSVSTRQMENPNSGESQRHYVEKWGGLPFPPSETFPTPYNDATKTWKDW